VAVEVDLEGRRIEASVGDLLGDAEQRSIGLTGSGLTRMWIGQELHRRVQGELQACEPGYRAEVAVGLETEIDGWTVVIQGRADGVAYAGGRPVRVDEIKTLHFAVDLHNLYASERLERFRRQARLYAHMLSPPGEPIAARLLLADIVSGETREEEVAWSPEAVSTWLRHAVHRLVAVERRRLEHLETLRDAAANLAFPHPVMRRPQETIVAAVEEALDQGRHLLLSAPTGSGKTAAVLYPALRAALFRGHRLFFLTAKTLQQRLAVQTARAMQGGQFRSLQLRAKAKMCANREIICHEEHCPFARDYGLKLAHSQLLDSLLDSADHLDPDEIFAAARAHEVCPFEVSLDLLPEADLVVCDYNYVFDPTVGLHAVLGGRALRAAVLVVDEAHNLVDRSREYYSPAFDLALLDRARKLLDTRDVATYRTLSALVDRLTALVRRTVSEALGDRARGTDLAVLPEEELSELRIALDGAMLQYFLFKRENNLWMAADPVMEMFLAVTRFHRVLRLGGDEFVHLATRGEDVAEELKIFCRDASRFIGEVLEESAGTVAMSATLEPFGFYRDLLGFAPPRTDTLRVPSPFPAENRLVVAVDDVDTSYSQRTAHYDGIAHWVARIAQPDRNVLALFPSYGFLAAVRDRLPPVPHTLLIQQPGSSDGEQRELLDALSGGSSHLVMAVLGGIFAEGVDYPGDMLAQVIVVSPGLPQFNVERELLKRYFKEVHGHGFEYAYLIPGLTRVVQAAGRLIRSDTDRGVITLICRRFQDRRYARLLPEEWTEGDPSSMLRPDPEAAVRTFFASPVPVPVPVPDPPQERRRRPR